MKTNKLSVSILCSLLFTFAMVTKSNAAGWCGYSDKVNCGIWKVQFNLFGDGQNAGGNDCVSFDSNNCWGGVTWDWSYTNVWTQMLMEKRDFCNKNFKISNTKDFNVKYNGQFSNRSGDQRLAIVSWAKTADNCNWTTDNLFELYVHERSYENNGYASWCTYKGESPSCSGSTYKLYDCGFQIIGRSIRCWRNNQRNSGTTDIDCLWEAWRNIGIAPDVYYYFTEVGCEGSPNSKGKFKLTNYNMTRVAESSGGGSTGGGGSASIVNNGVYRLKCNWGNKMLHATGNFNGANVDVANRSNGQWSQQWVLRKYSGNVYRIQNRWTGKYLHVTGTYNNANVTHNNLNNNWSSQRWELKKVSGDTYRLQVKHGNKYLTGQNTNGGYAKIHGLNNSWSSQRWTLEYTGTTSRKGEEELLAEAPANKFNVYQNTANDVLSITGLNLASATVYNLSGQLAWESDKTSDIYEVKTGDFNPGIYVIKAYDAFGKVNTQKIILQ